MIVVSSQDSAVTVNSITIRDLSGSEEFRQMEQVQTQAWSRDARSLVPWEFMRNAQYSGAVVLGAFDGLRLVGYAFGILGSAPLSGTPFVPAGERLQMYSHQLAVLPEYQSLGIGRRLKLAQRDFCRRHGIELMTWTFDPLMGRNGWLNFGILGGITRTFLADWYGELRHRFILEWWLNSEGVTRRIDDSNSLTIPPLASYLERDVPIANPTAVSPDGLVVPPAAFEMVDNPQVLLEIPSQINDIGSRDPQLERTWRLHIKEIIPAYFAAGYSITGVTRQTDDLGRRIYYLLTK